MYHTSQRIDILKSSAYSSIRNFQRPNRLLSFSHCLIKGWRASGRRRLGPRVPDQGRSRVPRVPVHRQLGVEARLLPQEHERGEGGEGRGQARPHAVAV
jgi:hypothetical protein